MTISLLHSFFCFSFKAPAPHVLSPACPPLSLRDALPLCPLCGVLAPRAYAAGGEPVGLGAAAAGEHRSAVDRLHGRHCRRPPHHPRRGTAEEHTSELRPQMRISYALCCLKKTKKEEQTYRLR